MDQLKIMARRGLKIVAVVVCAFVLTGCLTAEEQSFLDQTNSLRASKGLPALVENEDLTLIARRWSQHMGAQGQISHSKVGDARFAALPWRTLGENVGTSANHSGWTASVQKAFVNSPAHYANLVKRDYSQVGIGVATGADGKRYVTVLFMAT